MRRPSAGLLLASVLGAAAVTCGDPTGATPTIPLGLVSASIRSAEGSYVVRPEAAFVNATVAPSSDSRSTLDSCLLGAYDPTQRLPEHLDAGDSLVFTAGLETTILRPNNSFGVIRYVADPPEQAFVPGTAVSFTIPGAAGGFPAATISSLTPLALTALTPIPGSPSTTEPTTLAWEPVGDDSSRVEVLLLYAGPGSLDYDQQIVCDWRDDGSGTIRPELLSGWIQSQAQRAEVTRYRTQRTEIGDAVLYLLATFDTTPPVVP